MFGSFLRHSLVRAKDGPKRLFSTRLTPVDLHYDLQRAPDSNKAETLDNDAISGTKRNWLSLSKAFARDLQRPVYALDLRNHGTSPHAEPMSYEAMALDVLHFCENHFLSNISLLGHSMGGKVAMSLALSSKLPSNLLSHLIVADIAPSRGALSKEFQDYITAMREIEEKAVVTRKEAQDLLTPYEPDPMTRAFLLTNLDAHSTPMKFRIPLNIVGPSIPNLGSFPYEPGETKWNGKTLFIKGTRSKYINDRNIPLAKQFFPNMSLETLDAGHWVHAERPNEFKKMVVDFIKGP